MPGSPSGQPIITLLTDFGHRDGYPGVMKGVIWSIAPNARLVDLSHDIPAQNVHAGALVLGRAVPYFPPGTIHVAVVDPGVGSTRRAISARLGEQYFVLPDNGLLTYAREWAAERSLPAAFIELDRPEYWLQPVSRSFHGRDIFAPAAAHLAAGAPWEQLGTPIEHPLLLPVNEPRRTPEGWQGAIIDVDRFGNLITNLTREHLEPGRAKEIRLASSRIKGIVQTFSDRPAGEIIAMYDSDGRLSICQVNGHAAEALRAGPGSPVEVVMAAAAGGWPDTGEGR